MSGAESLGPGVRQHGLSEPALTRENTQETSPRTLWERTLLIRRAGALVLTSLAAGAVGTYANDVHAVEAELANTSPTVAEFAVPPRVDVGTIDLPPGILKVLSPEERRSIDVAHRIGGTGFITFSGVGRAMIPGSERVGKPFEHIAANLAMIYDPMGVDADTNVDAIKPLTNPNGQNIRRFIVYGNSAGASIGIHTAARLVERDPGVSVPAIIVDSGAIHSSVVRPESLRRALTMLDSFNIPGVEHSHYARIVGEMMMRSNEVHDIGSFFALKDEVTNEVLGNKDLPTNALFGDEVEAFLNSPVQQDLKMFGALPPERRPLLFFIGADNPADDDVVDDTKSYALLKKWASDAHLELGDPLTVKDMLHGEPERRLGQYNRIFKTEIIPQIVEKLAIQDADIAAKYGVN